MKNEKLKTDLSLKIIITWYKENKNWILQILILLGLLGFLGLHLESIVGNFNLSNMNDVIKRNIKKKIEIELAAWHLDALC